jgi:hypothetical protein
MFSGIQKFVNHIYPRNYIIRKPVQGAFIIAASFFGFLIMYKPLGVHASRSLSFVVTMAIYCMFSGIAAMLAAALLKSFRWFSDKSTWTLLKELLAVFLVLLGTGIAIYFIGFIMEVSSPRWNISTFLDSIKHGFLIGIIPFLFFTLINYRHLSSHSGASQNPGVNLINGQSVEELINISSQLKKETLSFYPSELIYAESDGNYVVFYLVKDKQVKKETIRNSINNIEQQLSGIPYFLRTHRAFIVNMKKVISKHGTTLGYSLKLNGTDTRIPVSRNNTRKFRELFHK